MFNFELNIDCWYDTVEFGSHTNKIGGISYLHPHFNSVRLAYRPSRRFGYFELFTYTYSNCEVYEQPWIEISAETLYECHIHADSGRCRAYYRLWEYPKKLMAHKSVVGPTLSLPGFYNTPYFGGNPVAPHQMNIFLHYYKT
jgi:hypothetical protein